MMQGMARFYLFSFLLMLALTAIAMISVLSADRSEIRALPRPVWILLILMVPLVGPVLYFWLGRAAPGRPDPAGRGAKTPRPIAPDDDPDFLSRLNRQRDTRPAHDARPPHEARPARDARTADEARTPDEARTSDEAPPSDD